MIEIKGLDNPTFLMPGVAVVADSTWAAFKGRDALVVQWEEGPYAGESNATITEQFQKLLAAPPATLHNSGRVDDALAAASAVVDNTYSFPFVSHATLEPHNCTADYRPSTGEMWVRGPIQMPMSAQSIVARATGIAMDKIHVHATRIGGGFGRRLMSDYAAEAAVVAKAIGGPVMVIDSREGDLQHDYYRPAAMQRLRAGTDAQRKNRRRGITPSRAARAMCIARIRAASTPRRPTAVTSASCSASSSSMRISSRRGFPMRVSVTARP